jgi:hypothetical protein
MSVHLLPCDCGNLVQVSTAAAGTKVACGRCGQTIHAPRLVELMALPRFVEPHTKENKETAETHTVGRARRRTMLLIWVIVIALLILLGLVLGSVPTPGFLVVISVPLLLAWLATIFVRGNTWQALFNRLFIGSLIAWLCYFFAFGIGAADASSALRDDAAKISVNQWMIVAGVAAAGFAALATWVLELANRTASHGRRGLWIAVTGLAAIITLQGLALRMVIAVRTIRAEDLAFSTDGSQIAAILRDDFGCRVVSYDIARDTSRTVYSRPAERFEFALKLADSGDHFLLNEQVSGDHQRRCVLFDIASGNQMFTFEPPQFHWDTTLSRDGKWIATKGFWESSVWSGTDGKWQRNFASDHDRVASVLFLGKSNRLAVGYEDGSVLIWPMDSVLSPIKLTDGVSGEGPITLFCSDDETVLVGVHGIQMKAVLDLIVWDIRGPQPILVQKTFEPDRPAVELPAGQVPDESQAIVVDYHSPNMIKVFRVSREEVFHQSILVDRAKEAIARLSPDKKRIAVLESNGVLSLFDDKAHVSRRVVFVHVWPLYLVITALLLLPCGWAIGLHTLRRRHGC